MTNVAVVGNQKGDEGKGKGIDVLCENADVNIRANGGSNAGHTIYLPDGPIGLNLIPSGIRRDTDGLITMLGQGVAFCLPTFLLELEKLKGRGLSYNNLMVSNMAKLVLPIHVALDLIRSGEVGTTGRGIGPCYTDHPDRTSIFVGDLLNFDEFARKLARNIDSKLALFLGQDPEKRLAALSHERAGGGRYLGTNKKPIAIDAILDDYREMARELDPFVIDSDAYIREILGKKRIVIEAGQGLGLSVNHGTYPFVTSSDTSRWGVALGAGIPPSELTKTFGVVKMYESRVGKGPFPTEYGDSASEDHCNGGKWTRESELAELRHLSMNDPNPFNRGIALRIAGGEYGTATGRLRRVGALDLVELKRAVRINGPLVVLTLVDILDQMETISLCTAYRYTGPDYRVGKRTLRKGEVLDECPPDPTILANITPIFTKFEGGYGGETRGVRQWQKFPRGFHAIVDVIEKATGAHVNYVSNGPAREDWVTRS